MIKKYRLLIATLFPFCISVEAHIPDTLSLQPFSLVGEFASLEKNRITTGILEDYGVTPVDFSLFDGSTNNSGKASIHHLYGLLVGINASTINNNNIPPNALGLFGSMSSSMASTSRVPVGVVAYRYTRICDDAMSSGHLQVVQNELTDVYVNNVWQDPYSEAILFAFAPYLSVVGRSVTYDFSTAFQYTNLSIQSMMFDPGTGVFQNVSSPIVSIYYPSAGQKTARLKITLTDNTQYFAYSDLYVTDLYDGSVSPSHAFFTSDVASNGEYPTASVDVLFANGTNTGFMKQPIIVAEVFDPISDYCGLIFHQSSPLLVKGRGSKDINTFRNSINSDPAVFNLNDYDLVYINWNNSTSSIQSNASIFKKVIRWVNELKPPGTRSIVIGQSMGGLIARYALCDMETHYENHQVSVFVSDDSPHLGAHVPLGALYAAQWLFNAKESIIMQPVWDIVERNVSLPVDISGYGDELMEIRNGISVRQMLKNYVNNDYEIDNTVASSFQDTLRIKGFPHGDAYGRTLNLALSNGGVNAYVTDTTTTPYIDARFEYGKDSSKLSGSFVVFPYTAPDVMAFDFEIKYHRQLKWGPQINPKMTLGNISFPSSFVSREDANGCYFSVDSLPKSFSFTDCNILLSGLGKMMFVPTASALCYKKGESPLTASDYNRDYLTSGVDMDLIPFDGYGFHRQYATMHTEIGPDDLEWICSIQNLSIVDTVYSDGSRQYFLNESGFTPAWSTSAPTIATINNIGQLTISGYGDVVIYATVGDSQNKLRLKKELHIPPPPLSGFPTYSLAARDMTLEGVFDHDDFHVTATPSAQIDSTIAPYVKYCWGRKVGNSSSITWTESTSRSNWITMGISEDHMVYFKVRYLNYYSQTYSVLCHARPRIVIIDPFGNLYTEDMGGESFVQVKGSDEQWVVTCMGESVVFDHNPSLSEICTEMLNYPAFKNKVKEVRPWGEEERVVIPYVCEKSGSGNVENDVIVFVYREDEYEE